MRTAYKVLAWLIALEVAIQAMFMVWAISGLFIWVDADGGVLDKAAMESNESFPEVVGFMLHGINGTAVIPLLALIFLIVSFFAKVPGGVKWAGLTLLLVVLQAVLGIFGREMSVPGALHGLNALVLFSVAVMAGKRVGSRRVEPTRTTAATGERELV